MAILIDIKKKKTSNVVYIEDYLDNRPGRIRRPVEDFNKQIADTDEQSKLNRRIVECNKEADIIDREIAEYKAEAVKASERLKTKLFTSGDYDGND